MRVVFSVALLLVFGFAIAQRASTTGEALDVYITNMLKQKSVPGASLLIVNNGKTLKSLLYGFSNLEHQVPTKMETVYEIASVSKPITALAIMQLEEEGKIVLDSSISNYIGNVPPAYSKITVKHLLSHTSGLPEIHFNFQKLYYPSMIRYTTKEQLTDLFTQKLLFPPGEGFQYSNGGFFLLAVIVSNVSKMPYQEYMQKNIFSRAMMKNTRFINGDSIVPNRAQVYTLRRGTMVRWTLEAIQALDDNGFGGLMSTAGDLALLYMAMFDGKIVSKQSLAKMMVPVSYKGEAVMQNGSRIGLGWFVRNINGKTCIEHSGHTGTMVVNCPEEKFTLVLLSNLSQGYSMAGDRGFDVDRVGVDITSRILNKPVN